ncbi:MAG: hypothetical protein II776_06830 [Clostridia bacterium]|nr:hypothetical protein [Clostridia bacterium]
MNYWRQSKDYVYVAGHRGWPNKFPENTIASFRGALTLPLDQVETDVRITKDGELVLIHDATVDRTTDGTGEVRDFTLAELKKLDAGSWKDPAFAGERIPTLREFMEVVKDHPTITLDIELKEYPDREEGWDKVAYDVCDRTLAMIEEYGFQDRVVINTFSAPLTEYLHKKYPQYRTHVYFPRFKMKGEGDPYPGAYCSCVYGPKEVAEGIVTSQQILDFAKETGIRVWAGVYAKNEETVDLALSWNAEMITANNPDEVLEILRRKGLHD